MDRRPRRPRLIGQLTYPLPDGSPDPASPQDCGESCVSSIVSVARGIDIAPGCLREALGGPAASGITTAVQLAWLLDRLAVQASIATGNSVTELRLKVGSGHWVLPLGYWAGPLELHWVVLYDYGPIRNWFMDPWYRANRSMRSRQMQGLFEGTAVVVRDPNPR